jgi:cytochrome c oxidase subunit 3
LPLLNTFLLLGSGAAITYSHHALIGGNRYKTLIGIIITLILAVLFTLCQLLEYYNCNYSIADSVYGASFFLSTGFHGLHVIIGTAFLAVGG